MQLKKWKVLRKELSPKWFYLIHLFNTLYPGVFSLGKVSIISQTFGLARMIQIIIPLGL